MEFLDLGTIIFMVAAVVIFLQLRNVLGRRTGNERPPFDPYTAGRKRPAESNASDNVVSLPKRKGAQEAVDQYVEIDQAAAPGSELNKGMRAIRDADAGFQPKTFVDGAKMAYE